MKVEIDQSGKVEQTNKNTILCLSNDNWDAIIIKAKTKRQLQEIFRRHGQIRNFIIFTFSSLLAILIKRNLHLGKITIDQEYFGKEKIIMNKAVEDVWNTARYYKTNLRMGAYIVALKRMLM